MGNLRDWERTYWQVFFEKEIEKLESDSIKAVDLTKEDAQKGHENWCEACRLNSSSAWSVQMECYENF